MLHKYLCCYLLPNGGLKEKKFKEKYFYCEWDESRSEEIKDNEACHNLDIQLCPDVQQD